MSMSYGTTVRSARSERGLTQAQLAENSGIEQSNISAIENGRRQPSAETLHRLLFACGFELVAMAGSKELAIAPPDAWFDGVAIDEPQPFADHPVTTKARMLVGTLDASEAIIQSR